MAILIVFAFIFCLFVSKHCRNMFAINFDLQHPPLGIEFNLFGNNNNFIHHETEFYEYFI